MDYGKVLGVTTGGLGAGAIAVLFSTIAAVAIKRHYKA
jgi:hypothetical protein